MSCTESGRPSMYLSIALSSGVTIVGHNKLSSSYLSVYARCSPLSCFKSSNSLSKARSS
ncbi:hypothetical protein HanIR_Chr17g0887941 [Helianthus annuus]|nr:hypothetical protein HanIR_Chr17g0887941 [Helianthus annuus]